ncbi:hypothetical protein ACFCP7_20060 [Paenibacillus elgii]
MSRWSKLQKELYLIITDQIDFQIHCVAYRMDSVYGSTDLPRYWITLDQDTIWDYPKQFVTYDGGVRNLTGFVAGYPYTTDISDISKLIREYIETPKNELMSKVFEHDHWGLINILRCADRRIGRRRFKQLRKKIHNKAALKVLQARMDLYVGSEKSRGAT